MEKLDCRAGFSYFTDFLFFCSFFVEGLSFGKFLVACYVLPSFLLYTSSKYIHFRGSIFEYLIWLWLFPRPLNTIKIWMDVDFSWSWPLSTGWQLFLAATAFWIQLVLLDEWHFYPMATVFHMEIRRWIFHG